MQVIYEDNHVIIVAKQSGEIVQGDKTGDRPLSETVKDYIKQKYQKPGAVFLGVVHRLDRPVSGLVVFARTSKALSRLNDMFRLGQVHKTYWAIVATPAQGRGDGGRAVMDGQWHELEHWLVRNEQQNKSYAYDHEVPRSKHAVLRYRPISRSERYTLLEVQLLTGRHHQIRCQLAAMGCPIRGDLLLENRRDVRAFLSKMQKCQANPLLVVTGGIHMHTVRVPDEETLQAIRADLRALHILVEDGVARG